MPFEAFRQSAGFLWLERLVQGSCGMGVEIVGNKDYFFCPGIQYIGSISENLRKIQRCPALRYNGLPPACQGFGDHKDIRDTVTDVYGIHFFRLSGAAGDTGLLYKLFARFIYTDNRTQWVIWTLIYIQYILHFRHEFGICLRNAPFLYKPWFDFVFFITSQTVLSVM